MPINTVAHLVAVKCAMEEIKIILGSASPRRKELLEKLGIDFEVITADVDEDCITVSNPADNVLARARLKAAALKEVIPQNAMIITADTTVADQAEMLNKPIDEAEAGEMLKQLRGHAHQVHTGLIVISAAGIEHAIVNTSDVLMRPYTDDEIMAYIATGDPMDKAGAYAIQHPDFRPVASIDGCYSGIMGLPLCDIVEILTACGVKIPIVQKLNMEEVKDFYLCERCKQIFENSAG